MKKLIDEKGKLFGIVNIVDLIVITLVILVIGVITFRFTTSTQNLENTTILDEKQDVYVTLYANSVIPEVATTLRVGDKLIANNKFTDAEIVDIVVTPAALITTDADGKPHLEEHPMWKDIVITIKDTTNVNAPIIKAGEQEVRVSYTFILKTQKFEVATRIRKLDFVPEGTEYEITPLIYDTEELLELAASLNEKE